MRPGRRSRPTRKAHRTAGLGAVGLTALAMLVPPTFAAAADPAPSPTASASSSPSTQPAGPATPGARRTTGPFRVMITSDAEIDDVASFHRLLLESDDLADSLEAVIYSSSTFHWAGDPTADPPIPASNWAGSDVFQNIIDGTGAQGAGGGYAAVVDNLRKHDARYPSAAHLDSLIKVGNVSYRGEMAKDTEGSDTIKAALLDSDPRPLYLPVWGGTNTVAAALRSIEDQYKGTAQWKSVQNRVVSKARVTIVLDQDETYKDYIAPHWPTLDVVVNRDQFWTVAYRGYRYTGDNGAPRVPQPIEDAYFGPAFMSRLRTGPLMGTYPVSSDAHKIKSAYPDTTEFLSEGDSPSYFGLLDNGLRSDEDPTWGGWGGRFAKVGRHRWTDFPSYLSNTEQRYDQRNYDLEASRVRDVSPYKESYDVAYPQARWIPALQEELAAKSAWQTKSYADANHAPEVQVAGGKVDIKGKRGKKIKLNGIVDDPDGDALVTTWWQYREAGTYKGSVDIADASKARASFVVPKDAKSGRTIHLVLEVKDRTDTPFTRYARVVVTVR